MRIVILAALVLLIVGASIAFLLEQFEDEYSGKEVFQTEQEYWTFSMALAEARYQGEVDIQKGSSIIVSFTACFPEGHDFPYGKKSLVSNNAAGVGMAVGTIAGLISIFLLPMPTKPKKEE